MQGIFDSHAHYDDERYDLDRDEVINMIRQNGVSNVINVGCDVESSKTSIEFTKKYQGFYATVGIHPGLCDEVESDYIDKLRELSKDEKVVAIGEIGLDYHYDGYSKEQQFKVFEEQLKLSKEVDLPVVIHSRDAAKDTMDFLNQYKPEGVVHCFSGSLETAKEVLKLSMYIGFTGVVTFKNAKKALEVIKYAPLDRILVETDCPYMAPEPYRGQRTTSDMIKRVAEVIADIKGITPQEVIDITNKNAKVLFEIK